MTRLHLNAFMPSMAASALISFFHIFHSNTFIADRVKPLIDTGQLVVPNETILNTLTTPMPALAAAVFFVLTAGVFITEIAMASHLLIHGLIQRRSVAVTVYLSFWAIATLVLNYRCFSWIAAAHTLVIPLVVNWLLGARKKRSKKEGAGGERHSRLLVFILALAVTGTFFSIKGDRGMFLRTRDYLLLSNRPGQVMTQWYYTYSPYASEALRNTMPPPSSIANDRMIIFRKLCLAGLLVGLPLLLFEVFFLVVGFLLARIMAQRPADHGAALLTTAVAIGLLVYLTPMDIGFDRKSIERGLNATASRTRIETLRAMVNIQADIFNFFSEKNLEKLAQGTVPERYWLSKAMGVSPDRRSIPILERLANEDAINVQCAALKALSKKGCGPSRRILVDKIKKSPHWYVQKTALGGLKQCRKKIQPINGRFHVTKKHPGSDINQQRTDFI